LPQEWNDCWRFYSKTGSALLRELCGLCVKIAAPQ
jgi:hypothetical protein